VRDEIELTWQDFGDAEIGDWFFALLTAYYGSEVFVICFVSWFSARKTIKPTAVQPSH